MNQNKDKDEGQSLINKAAEKYAESYFRDLYKRLAEEGNMMRGDDPLQGEPPSDRTSSSDDVLPEDDASRFASMERDLNAANTTTENIENLPLSAVGNTSTAPANQLATAAAEDAAAQAAAASQAAAAAGGGAAEVVPLVLAAL